MISNLKEGKALSKIAEHENLTNYEQNDKWETKKPVPEAGQIFKFNPLYELEAKSPVVEESSLTIKE